MNVFEIKCLRLMVGVTRSYRVRDEETRRRAWAEEALEERLDRRV